MQGTTHVLLARVPRSCRAVEHLVLCPVEKRPPGLDLDVYPYLPKANDSKTSAASYLCSMSGGHAMSDTLPILLEHRLNRASTNW